MRRGLQLLAVAVIGWTPMACFAQPAIGTAFTYQGQLKQNGQPVNGTVNLAFFMYSAIMGGMQIGSPVIISNLGIENGLFVVSVNTAGEFGPDAFDGQKRWLEIWVNGVPLSPRQELTATPHSLFALKAPWTGLTGLPSGFADGVDNIGSAGAGLQLIGDTFSVASTSITNSMLADDSVTTSKIADSEVTTSDLADDCITTEKLTDGAIQTAKIQDGAVTSSKLSAGAATSEKIAFPITTESSTTPVFLRYGAQSGPVTFTVSDSLSLLVNRWATGGSAASFLISDPQSDNTVITATHSSPTGRAALFGGGVHIGGSGGRVLFYDPSVLGYAGYFEGNVHVTGSLSKGGGGFRIDDPLDPENKYLNHSFVEAPERVNLYHGIVILDTDGRALVELPQWFDTLNRDFRYQLSAIGTPMPNLYVAEEISNNDFVIAGGEPRGKVSWQVTAVRQDPWARANPMLTEEPKRPEDQGQFLNPELYGRTPDHGIGYHPINDVGDR